MNANRYSSIFQVVTLASHTFMPGPLGGRPIILDIGANQGEFHRSIRQLCDPLRYIAIEANPALADGLREANHCEVLNVAIGSSNESVRLAVNENCEASRVVAAGTAVATVEVQGRTLERLLEDAQLDRVDLLKVDIEGAEVAMIMEANARIWKRFSQITVEFHDFCGISTASEVLRTIRHLNAMGFEGIRFSRNNTNWLFVRREAPGVSLPRLLIAKKITSRLRRLKHKVLH